MNVYEFDRLRAEDGVEFERLVDQALHSEEIKVALRHADRTLRTEQLRTEALRARPAIVATANTEYRSYLQLRAAATHPHPTEQQPTETTTRTGGGLLPVLGVLAPGLAAAAAAIFLLLGFGLQAVGLRSHLADELVVAGLTAAGVAVTATLCGLTGLLITAARNRSTAYGSAPECADPEVRRANEAWREAVLERGVLPFLLGWLDETTTNGSAAPASDNNQPDQRTDPGFSPPDFTRPGFTNPDFTRPGFTSPDFTDPETPRTQ